MNLRGIANQTIQRVNPDQQILWQRSTGYTTDAAGRVTPTYRTDTVQAQIQATSGKDLQHVDALNVSGVMRSVYLYGNVQGVVRADRQGGDLLCFPETPCGPNKTWLITSVVETWPDWAHVIVVLQEDKPCR